MDVAAELLAGNVTAGARAIRWLDDRDPRGREVLRQIISATGRAHVVGVTGPPGPASQPWSTWWWRKSAAAAAR